jgi:hypothetical protein
VVLCGPPETTDTLQRFGISISSVSAIVSSGATSRLVPVCAFKIMLLIQSLDLNSWGVLVPMNPGLNAQEVTNEGPAYMHQNRKLAPPGQQILWCGPMFGAYMFLV